MNDRFATQSHDTVCVDSRTYLSQFHCIPCNRKQDSLLPLSLFPYILDTGHQEDLFLFHDMNDMLILICPGMAGTPHEEETLHYYLDFQLHNDDKNSFQASLVHHS